MEQWARPLRFKKYHFFTPKPLEVPIRGRVQIRILELSDEAGEKQKRGNSEISFFIELFAVTPSYMHATENNGFFEGYATLSIETSINCFFFLMKICAHWQMV